jgi:acetylornithine deacetylase/succinyl-diaminopimelate desuccinylase-like protein
VNLIARIRGNGDGRRLVFNGHLDTFPVGQLSEWTVDPFGGDFNDGRIYGRGVTDMKGGVACSILATLLLAEMREAWTGEVVVTLAGDEETMGTLGTAWLLDQYDFATGDAMITGDAGSPNVLRFGEKGMAWLEIEAEGKAAHGAHVHLGVNAIERLMAALHEILKIRDLPVSLPAEVKQAIAESAAVSEAISGKGESDTLQRITVNCGLLRGGVLNNIVPPDATASLDIRLPAGISVAEIENKISAALDHREGVTYRITRRFEPLWTDPKHEIVDCLKRAGREALGRTPVANYRVGGSDARFYRQRNVPAIVCGPTPHNMGRADEFVEVEELCAVHYMHTLAAFDYLRNADLKRDTEE